MIARFLTSPGDPYAGPVPGRQLLVDAVARAAVGAVPAPRWRPRFGDDDLVGWCTVVAYVLAAALAWRARGRIRALGDAADDDGLDPGDARRLTRFWTVTAVAMVVLGVNKQLDLQTWLIEHARRAAFAEGWYDDRRRVQAVFVLAVAAAGLGATWWGVRQLRGVAHQVALALVGLGVIVSFVAVRAASLHQIDHLLSLGPVRLNTVLEFGGIGLVALAGLRVVRRPTPAITAPALTMPSVTPGERSPLASDRPVRPSG